MHQWYKLTMIDLSEDFTPQKEKVESGFHPEKCINGEKKLPFAIYYEKNGGDTFSCGGSLRDGSDNYLGVLIEQFKVDFLEAERKVAVELPKEGSGVEYYLAKNWHAIFYTKNMLPEKVLPQTFIEDDCASGTSIESGTVESIQYEIDLYVDKKTEALNKEIIRLRSENQALRKSIEMKTSSQLYMNQIKRLYNENIELKNKLEKLRQSEDV